jgi:hypothetical protein
MTKLYVKVVNDKVTECWDIPPPAGELGWKQAVEIRPDIIPNRQDYESHYFDLTTDPVQIVYKVRDFTLEDRKNYAEYGATLHATYRKEEIEKNTDMTPDEIAAAVEEIRLELAALAVKVESATTHEELDIAMGIS